MATMPPQTALEAPEKAVAIPATSRKPRPPQGAVRAPETKHDGARRLTTRAYALELSAAGDDGTIEGYGSVFGEKDSYDDIVAPGAFKASLAEHRAAGRMPAMLWQHDPAEPIGVWTEMTEDAKGLRVRGKLVLESDKARGAHALLKAGALNGLSIGFVSKQWNYDKDAKLRTMTEVDLWEVSLVTFPAMSAARITSVKSADVASILTIRQAEKVLRDAGFSHGAISAFMAGVKRIVLDERDARDAAARAEVAAERLLASFT